MSFYTERGNAIHYLKNHYYNSDKHLSYCPLCSFFSENILDHMSECHAEFCCFCAKLVNSTYKHSTCLELLERAKQMYKENNLHITKSV